VEYLAVPLAAAPGEQRETFVVARFLAEERAEVADTVEVAGGIIGVLLLLATGLAWGATGRALAPVRLLTETARSLSDTDLSRRIPVGARTRSASSRGRSTTCSTGLESAFTSQRAFLQDAGHELRTPITIVRGHLELMDDDPDRRRSTLALVDDELRRMGRMVDDLLLLARAQRPDFLHLDDVDVVSLTQEAAGKALGLGPRLWRVDEVAEGVAEADRQRLTQALVQLAANAVQHTQVGDEIGLGSRARGRELWLWVRDTGPGVPAADRQRVFERFHRGGQGRRRSEGAGLGLPIVRAIAEAHGGRVQLDSSPGRGATFTLVLPVLRPQAR
jgi:two-component system OmpR family sensor kinase